MASINLISRRLINISLEKFIKSKVSNKNRFLSASYFPNLINSNRRYGKTYEGKGNTVAVIINRKSAETLTINSVTSCGIVLSSEAELVGATILFPNAVFSWCVTSAKDVTEESLTLFKILEPKIDILVFGYGTPQDYTPQVRQNFTQICKKFGLKYEALPTEQAAGLFNFFSYEERFVAAALIPPKNFDPHRFRVRPKLSYLDLDEDNKDEEDCKSLSLNKDGTRKLLA